MKIIETAAPIKIEDLKKYFEDKTTFFLIDYASSTIKGDKLLVYISNLDIPCDINLKSAEETQEILSCYLNSSFLVNLPTLEKITISLLLENKGLKDVDNAELLTALKPQLDAWTEKLESLVIYNLYTINDEEIRKWVTENHKTDETASLEGVNFLSLLKNEDFYEFYLNSITEPKYYSTYFNEYMFKGQNLYAYWANENNPMFLLTYGIGAGLVKGEEYAAIVKESQVELN